MTVFKALIMLSFDKSSILHVCISFSLASYLVEAPLEGLFKNYNNIVRVLAFTGFFFNYNPDNGPILILF